MCPSNGSLKALLVLNNSPSNLNLGIDAVVDASKFSCEIIKLWGTKPLPLAGSIPAPGQVQKKRNSPFFA